MKIIRSAILFGTLTLLMYVSVFFGLAKVESSEIPLLNHANTFYSIKGNTTYSRFWEFNPVGFDVVVYGSSHAYRGYDPRNFEEVGLSCYNLGSSSQSIRETCLLIEHYPQPEKLMIIDLYPGTFSTEGTESASLLIANVPEDELAAKIAFETYDWRLTNCYLKRRFDAKRQPVYRDDTDRENYYQGYVACSDKASKELNYKAVGKEFKPREYSLPYFSRLVDFLEKTKARAVFVTHPLPHSINHTEMTEFSKAVNDVLDGRYPYLNYSFSHPALFDYQDDFYDLHHLNSSGVKKFNELLIADLVNTGLLKIQ